MNDTQYLISYIAGKVYKAFREKTLTQILKKIQAIETDESNCCYKTILQ